MRDLLLKLYDGAKLERYTLKQRVSIEEPALAILAAHVDATWHECVPADALADGFAQRFNYILARPRPGVLRPTYDLRRWYPRLRQTWRRLTAVPLAPVYKVSDEAVAVFEAAFHEHHSAVGGAMPASFFRRVMFSAVRYALVYHVVRGCGSPELERMDMIWAVSMIWRHLCDVARMLDAAGLNDLERRLARVRRVITKARERGEVASPRDLQQSLKVPAVQARALLELALEGDAHATAAERARATSTAAA